MRLARYADYKTSHVDWLGDVPTHWRVVPVKSVAKLINGYPFESSLFDLADGYPLVRIRDLNCAATECRYAGEFVKAAAIDSTDTLIGMDGDFNVGRWFGDGIALLNQRMCCVRTGDPLLNRFLEYVLPTPLKAINEVTYSTTVKHLSSLDVLKIRIALPPSQTELQQIIRFLDRETARIDALIDKKNRLIEILQEKRAALITQAVTRGLDQKVTLKASGVAWLSDIPSHWKVTPFKRLADFMEGPGILAVDFREEGVPLLRVSCVSRDVTTLDGCNFLDPEMVAKKWNKFRVAEEDLLISASATMGTVTQVGPDAAGAVPYTGIIRLRPVKNRCERGFLKWFVVSNPFLAQIEVQKAGSTIQHYGPAHLNEMVMTEPPLEEQTRIVAHIEREVEQIARLRHLAERAVERLFELRLSLVAAVVTGQIDVREAL